MADQQRALDAEPVEQRRQDVERLLVHEARRVAWRAARPTGRSRSASRRARGRRAAPRPCPGKSRHSATEPRPSCRNTSVGRARSPGIMRYSMLAAVDGGEGHGRRSGCMARTRRCSMRDRESEGKAPRELLDSAPCRHCLRGDAAVAGGGNAAKRGPGACRAADGGAGGGLSGFPQPSRRQRHRLEGRHAHGLRRRPGRQGLRDAAGIARSGGHVLRALSARAHRHAAGRQHRSRAVCAISRCSPRCTATAPRARWRAIWSTSSGCRRKGGQKLKATRINGVAERLQAVSDELDKLPAEIRRSTWCPRPEPTIAAWSPAPTASPRTATASPSISPRRMPTTGIGPSPAPDGRYRLQEPHPLGDRRGVREARLRLGRQVVPLRHHAFRVPAGDHRGSEEIDRFRRLAVVGASASCGSVLLRPQRAPTSS